MAKQYVCIHGHFYQPPRENPWLETIEVQDSAHPYHDWNDRIFWECYAPNASSRILDDQDKITHIVNNYERISFNFGPTLLSWLEATHPQLLQKIVAADRASAERFEGHGNALAQVYHHQIMPLASQRERQTQIRWGIEEFKKRFSRQPEGMWLAETAADLATLQDLADAGITFTILSPHQAKRIRPLDGKTWEDVAGGKIDPSRPYRHFLDKQKSRWIDILFYDAPISQAVGFAGLLRNGEDFYQHICQAFHPGREHAQLVTVASDGETYGHHTKFGDMALAYLLQRVEQEADVELINPACYLAKHPATFEVEIFSPSSWSCSHGVGRWQEDCGCNSGHHPGWKQAWRKPLREALDWLKSEVDKQYEQRTTDKLRDPWEARQRYIGVRLQRTREVQLAFLTREQARPLEKDEVTVALRALEMQRNSMLMFTSCGWFFDEVSGIETVQVLRYAARTIQLCRELGGPDLEEEFCQRLREAPSNLRRYKNGAEIFQQLVLPSAVTMQKVIAHHAISSFFDGVERGGDTQQLYCYQLERKDLSYTEKGALGLLIGQVRASSLLTQATEMISYAVLKIGNQDFHCSLKGLLEEADYNRIKKELLQAFEDGGTTETIRAIDRHFSTSYFTLNDLFLDERNRVFNLLMKERLVQLESLFRQSYEELLDFMRSLKKQGLRLPQSFTAASEWLLAKDLQYNLNLIFIDGNVKPLKETYQQIEDLAVEFKDPLLPKQIESILQRQLAELFDKPQEDQLQRINQALSILGRHDFQLDFWKLQNQFQQLVSRLPADARQGPFAWPSGDTQQTALGELAEKLGFSRQAKLLDD